MSDKLPPGYPVPDPQNPLPPNGLPQNALPQNALPSNLPPATAGQQYRDQRKRLPSY